MVHMQQTTVEDNPKTITLQAYIEQSEGKSE